MKKKWFWLLLPVVGAVAMLALPPADEYAALDPIGTRLDPTELYLATYTSEQGASAGAREDLRRVMGDIDRETGVRRRRAWKVGLPAGGGSREGDRLFPARFGWQKSSQVRFPRGASARSWVVQSSVYLNDETGDRVVVTQQATVGADRLTVEVSQSEASFAPWARVRRLARRVWAR